MKLKFPWQIFEKYSYIKFHKNLSGESRTVPCRWTDRQTDVMKLAVFFFSAILRTHLKIENAGDSNTCSQLEEESSIKLNLYSEVVWNTKKLQFSLINEQNNTNDSAPTQTENQVTNFLIMTDDWFLGNMQGCQCKYTMST
jgi:hypothetical protein